MKPETSTEPLLRVRGLRVRYPRADGRHAVAVDGLDLDLNAGEAIGLFGESGSGKTSLALAIAGLLGLRHSRSAKAQVDGSIELAGERVEHLDERAWRRLRGSRIGVAFQQPGLALHPLRRIGAQVTDVLRAHRWGSPAACRERAAEQLAAFGLGAELWRAYPHQLSGGQRQRVVLAQALVCDPPLLIADEATASLDPDTADAILDRLAEVRQRRQLAILWIDHDADRLARVVDRVHALYAGRWVEAGPVDMVLGVPRHPYVRSLLACRPGSVRGEDRRLPSIPGSAPPAEAVPHGCAFAPRCSQATAPCLESSAAAAPITTDGHHVWCVQASGDGSDHG